MRPCKAWIAVASVCCASSLAARGAGAQTVPPTGAAPAITVMDAPTADVLRTYVTAQAGSNATFAALELSTSAVIVGGGVSIMAVDQFRTVASFIAPSYLLLGSVGFITGGLWLRPGPSVALVGQASQVGLRAGPAAARSFAEIALRLGLWQEHAARRSLAWISCGLAIGGLVLGGLVIAVAVATTEFVPPAQGASVAIAQGATLGVMGALQLATGIYAATAPLPAETALRVLHGETPARTARINLPRPTIAARPGGVAIGLGGAF